MMRTDPAAHRLAGRITIAAVLLAAIWGCFAHEAEAFGIGDQESKKASSTEPRTVEATDAVLRDAMASARASRTCPSLTAVGVRYYELGLRDVAGSYLTDAIALDSKCAVAHDALAKVWRQAGLQDRALGSAHRATYFSPRTAAFWNTYGTVLQELGRDSEAADAYRRVIQLDPSAAYAHSNLCYLALQAGETEAATAACQAALAVDPGFVPAINNLALIRAASGNSAEAFALFSSAGSVAAAHYNMGMVRLVQRNLPAALTEFEAAYGADPAFDDAHAKARMVRLLLKPRSGKLSADDRRR